MICVNADTDKELSICFKKDKAEIKKLTHDIGLAIQDFYNKLS